jgi:hypothetical protein
MIPLNVRQDEVINGNLNLKAICVWIAFGCMLDNDTFFEGVYWTRPKTLPWHYDPVDMSFDKTVDKFAEIFENVVADQTKGASVLLALSGGLDSRTLAAAMSKTGKKPFTYSYKFENSFNETKYGKQIAGLFGWEYEDFVIPKGYLWDKVDYIAGINQCYTDLTHSRQVAVLDQIAPRGNLFLLGHLGDLSFDGMGVPDSLTGRGLIEAVIKKMLKKGGLELAVDLWKLWNIEGDFNDYLYNRVSNLLDDIHISNANAKIKAFKCMQWVTRWTNVNLFFFSRYHPIALPYYDERICEFVCCTSEEYLNGRKIQIEYLKRFHPKLAKIPWQDKEPYNLYNYHHYLTLRHLPWRLINKTRGVVNEKLFGKKTTLRNWEIQFVGNENDYMLSRYLLDNNELAKLIPKEVVKKYYDRFKTKNAHYYSHPVNMLLTLSVFVSRLKNHQS